MPIIDTRRADIAALEGLHLWHAAMSNCSQRVRLVLEEKSLRWTSHSVNLFTFEHASADYQSIHPKGLVPALVHDGRTIIDSNDIIRYLDRVFPEPSLSASGPPGESGGTATFMFLLAGVPRLSASLPAGVCPEKFVAE